VAETFYPGLIQVLCGLRRLAGGRLAKLTPGEKIEEKASKGGKTSRETPLFGEFFF
jgi:hypothetical protein